MTRDAIPLELEIKLLVPAGMEAELEAHPALAAPAETRQETTTYFDTEAGDLAQRGASLRIRRRGNRLTQTLKLRGAGGPFARGEWEWPVEQEEPALDRLAETPAAPWLGGLGPLRPAFTTEVRRSIRLLRRDGAVVEACLDRGEIRAGAAREEVRELELELKEGPAAPLYRLAAELQAAFPLTLGAEAKSERGWRLRLGTPRPAIEQPPLDLRPGTQVGEAFRQAVGASLSVLISALPAAGSGQPEGVHRLRIALRRLRAAIALFAPALDPAEAEAMTDGLRRIGRTLGEARDWDVFLDETLPAAAEELDDGGAPLSLRAAAEAARDAARARATAEIASPAFGATILRLAAWAEAPGGEAAGRKVGDAAAAMQERLERRVRRRGRHLRRRGTEELHALRKAVKRLRYGMEFLAPLHRPKQVKAHRRAARALQEGLGRLNDAAMAVALARGLAEGRPELASAVAALQGWAATRERRVLKRLPGAWRDFKDVRLPR
jgi:inorganic triphosphatase YgiF